ncbi:hypothetical protein ACE1TI_18725 [Alteribacillus sp. JSM 102045]|uniref:hypothetical protein n=1 Tax=Alteribacillus sp. JSM 102045 TaxID=1562101 RepID=UPI0035BEEED0
MSARKQTSEKGKEKIKDAFQSGNKRPSPAHAFFGENVKDNNEFDISTITEKDKTEPEQENVIDKHNSFSEQSKENNLSKLNNESENISASSKKNSFMDKNEVSVKNKLETEQENNLGDRNIESEYNSADSGFWGMIEQEKKKKRVEDTHQRDTFLIRKDLLREFNKMAKKQPKGFKTKAINYALENFLDEVKKNE